MFYTHTHTHTHTIFHYTYNGMYRYNGILLSHKKNDILPPAEIWRDLEGVMLSEIQTEKDKYCMISLICGI